MMTQQKTKHAHKYKRVKLNQTYKVYQCVKPGCGHYINVKLVVGQQAECWVCGDPFTMDQKAAKLAKPHCRRCVRRPDRQRKPIPQEVSVQCLHCGSTTNDPQAADDGFCTNCREEIRSVTLSALV